VSRVAGQVQGKNSQELKKKKKEKGTLWWTPSGAKWKNAPHPVDRTANWCIGGCWLTLPICQLWVMQLDPCLVPNTWSVLGSYPLMTSYLHFIRMFCSEWYNPWAELTWEWPWEWPLVEFVKEQVADLPSPLNYGIQQ
jgi:hypothetical protein